MPGCRHRHPILSVSHSDSASADTPVDKDIFAYEAASGLWRPKTAAELGIAATEHAPIAGSVRGTLSTGVKPLQIPYCGDTFTATKLYCRVTVAPQTTDLIISIRLNGVEIDTVTIAAGSQTDSTVIDEEIEDGDYFDIEITQTGTDPNFGAHLVWLVAP